MNQLLAQERRKRGLPEYASRAPVTTKKPRLEPVEMRECMDCGEEWPASEFSFASSAFSGPKAPCNDCYTKRYGKWRWRPCAGCGKGVGSRKALGVAVYHRECRRGVEA